MQVKYRSWRSFSSCDLVHRRAQPGEANPPYLTSDPGGHTAQVARVLFTPDGRQVLTISLDKSIRVWDVKTGRTLRVLRPPIAEGYEGSLYAAALSGDGRLLAVAGYNKPGSASGHIYLIELAETALETDACRSQP